MNTRAGLKATTRAGVAGGVNVTGPGNIASVKIEIATELGLSAGSEPPLERLIEYLRSRNVLLVLDNLEQVAEAGQAIVWAAVDGLKSTQIAELIGRSAGATREFLSQTRKRLREYLEPCLGLESS